MSDVYAIRSEAGLIKIGVSRNVTARIRNLQCAHGQPLKLVYRGPGNFRLEASLHAHYASARVMGEWFDDKDHNITKTVESVAQAMRVRGAEPSVLPPPRHEIQETAQDLIRRHGTLRNAGAITGLGYSLLSKIASGKRQNITLTTLKKLGLEIGAAETEKAGQP